MAIINSFTDLLDLVLGQSYFLTYLILFILNFLEGPIVTYLAAFAASLGYLNIYLIIIVSILGNQIPDIIFYFIGRSFRKDKIEKICSFFGLYNYRITWLEKNLKKHTIKTTLLIKLLVPITVPGIILSGFLKMNFKYFFWINLIINIIFALVFSLLGYYSGITLKTLLLYSKLTTEYLGIFILVIIISYFALKKIYIKKMKGHQLLKK